MGRHVTFIITKLVYKIAVLIQSLIPTIQSTSKDKNIVIEAGKNGWKSIFLGELFISAVESEEFDDVSKLCISSNSGYIKQNFKFLKSYKPKYFLFDIRTLQGNHIKRLIVAFYLVIIFKRFGIKPISILTDPSLRFDRILTIFITSTIGKIVTFIDYSLVSRFFYKSVVVGPILPPISMRTRNNLQEFMPRTLELSTNRNVSIGFIGDLYESRLKLFREIEQEIIKRNLPLDFIYLHKERDLDGTNYWNQILQFDLIITTTRQGIDHIKKYGKLKKLADFTDINQIVFRITETLVANRVLICEKAPGIEKFFDEHNDLITFSSVNDLLIKLFYLLENRGELDSIRKSGFSKISLYMNEDYFWRKVIN